MVDREFPATKTLWMISAVLLLCSLPCLLLTACTTPATVLVLGCCVCSFTEEQAPDFANPPARRLSPSKGHLPSVGPFDPAGHPHQYHQLVDTAYEA